MYKVAIITLSDKGARGEREDVSGPGDPGKWWRRQATR